MSETCEPCDWCIDGDCRAPVPGWVEARSSNWVVTHLKDYTRNCPLFRLEETSPTVDEKGTDHG